jgi:rhomboid family GlyGly-CTERM serine protease
MAGLAAGGAPVRDALALSRAGLQDAQLWRLLSAHFVHLGTYHAALNLVGLAILAWLCPQALTAREWLRRLLWLSLAVSAGVWLLVPALTSYVGFSGVLHGLFLLGLAPQARAGDRIAIACLLYLGGKLVWEIVVGVPLSDEQAIGGRVVTQAHLFGTLAALAYGLTFKTFARGDRHP